MNKSCPSGRGGEFLEIIQIILANYQSYTWFWDFIIIVVSGASTVQSSIIVTCNVFLVNNVNCHLEVVKNVKIRLMFLVVEIMNLDFPHLSKLDVFWPIYHTLYSSFDF